MEDVKIVTQEMRKAKELQAILGNERLAKNAARSKTLLSLYYPMEKPLAMYTMNKNGECVQSEESIKQQQAWERCKSRCKEGENPTMWDVMNEGQAYEAITNSASFVVVRDTAGLKPIDESKMVIQPENPYANMTMEQLELAKKIEMMDQAKVKALMEQLDE